MYTVNDRLGFYKLFTYTNINIKKWRVSFRLIKSYDGESSILSVSYTHLDVYKRQLVGLLSPRVCQVTIFLRQERSLNRDVSGSNNHLVPCYYAITVPIIIDH